MKRSTKTYILITVIVSIVFAISVFCITDKTPATDEDYLPLEKQIFMVEQNPQLLLKNEGKYTVEDGKFVAIFSNRQCKITAQYAIDESGHFKLMSSEKEDLSVSTIKALTFALLNGLFLKLIFFIFWFPTSIIEMTEKQNSRE